MGPLPGSWLTVSKSNLTSQPDLQVFGIIKIGLKIAGIKTNSNQAEHFYVQHSSQFFIQLTYNSSYKYAITKMKNSVDLDQLASEKPADLELHCFQTSIL